MWRPVVGYEGQYEVSDDGRVRGVDRHEPCNGGMRFRRGRELALLRKKTGYLSVNLYKNGTMSSQRVHRLVAQAFIPNPSGLPQVNHINGDKTDNRVVNLEWTSASDNVAHAFRTGIHPIDYHGRLSDEEVRLIRASKGPHRVIAEQFGISRAMVGLIKNGHVYKEVS